MNFSKEFPTSKIEGKVCTKRNLSFAKADIPSISATFTLVKGIDSSQYIVIKTVLTDDNEEIKNQKKYCKKALEETYGDFIQPFIQKIELIEAVNLIIENFNEIPLAPES